MTNEKKNLAKVIIWVLSALAMLGIQIHYSRKVVKSFTDEV